MTGKWYLGIATAAAVVWCSAGLKAQTYTVSDASPTALTSFGGAAQCDSCQKGGKGGCQSCGKGGCDVGCGDEGPCRLFPEMGCGWAATGWVALGATINADNPASHLNGPLTFNDRANFQANQLYMSFGRDADTGGCGSAWGARVDMLYGSDFLFTRAAGLELRDDGTGHWNRAGDQYGLALPQAYAEVAYNNLSLKLGHFYTIIGNEVVTAPDNFFFSHAYTMQYGEPFTHTGGLVTWQFNDCWTVWGGLVNGWDKFDATTDRAAFLGGASYTPADGRYTITATVITGDEDGTGIPDHTRTLYSLVFSYNINDCWQYVFQHDNGWNNFDAAGRLDEEWYGVNQYLFYTIKRLLEAGAAGRMVP